MIKNSLKTVFKFPIMIWGFALPVVAMLLCYLPFILTAFSNNTDAMMIMMMVTWLLFMLVGLFMQFVYLPVLFNYVHEASNGPVEKGWFKRGLKRNWWKIFVTTIIATIPYYIIYAIFFFAVFISAFSFGQSNAEPSIALLIIGSIIFWILTLFWLAFYAISLVSVSAEEKFEDGFKNIFKIGIKDIFRVTLTYVVSLLPAAIIGVLYGLYYFLMYDGYTPRHTLARTLSSDTSFFIITGILILLTIAINAIVMPFIYVYINKLYAKRKQGLIAQNSDSAQPVASPEGV